MVGASAFTFATPETTLEKCYKVRDEHVEEIIAAMPELKVIK